MAKGREKQGGDQWPKKEKKRKRNTAATQVMSPPPPKGAGKEDKEQGEGIGVNGNKIWGLNKTKRDPLGEIVKGVCCSVWNESGKSSEFWALYQGSNV